MAGVAGVGGSASGSGGAGGAATGGSDGSGGAGGSGGSAGVGVGGAAGGGGGKATGGGAGTGGAASGSGGVAGGGAAGAPSGGSAGSGASSGAPATMGCNGTVTTLNLNPFGCELAFGVNSDSASQRASYGGYLDFVTAWVLETEPGLARDLASTDAIPVYYGYIIGDTGHDHGFPDCNLGGPPNLCTHGAQMIRDNRSEIITKYRAAAQASYNASPNKPAVWLLEGDFIQYNDPSQTGGQGPLTFQELGELTAEITCAIKGAQPNAVVAMNHTTWNGDDETDDFWAAMPMEVLDMVWTTGVGDNDGFIRGDGSNNQYNQRTARYAYVSQLTERKIFVDESFGASREADTWINQSSSTLNGRVAEGVIAVNLTGSGLPGNLESAVSAVSTNSTCE
jgi:hypothetical protein